MTLPLLTDILPEPGVEASVILGTVQHVDTATGAVTLDIAGDDVLGQPHLHSAIAREGDTVLCLRQQERLWVIGSVFEKARPWQGTVTAVGAETVTVNTVIGSLTMPFTVPAPSVTDEGLILWMGGQPVFSGAFPSPPPPPPPPQPKPPPPPAPTKPSVTTGVTRFNAITTASWRAGWRNDTDDIVQGIYPGFPSNHGAWFYGGKIRSTLAGATCTGVTIRLPRIPAGAFAAQAVHLKKHNNDTRPPAADISYAAGGPWDAFVAVGQTIEAALPTSVGQALIDSGGGIATTSDNPYLRISGLSKDGSSGRLTISWSRSS